MRDLSYKYYYKKNLRLAIPIVFSNLGHMLTLLADTIMVGQLGANPLAAVSLAGNIFAIPLVSGIGLSLGITPLVGSAYGQNNYRYISSLFFNGLLFYTFSVLIFTLLLYLGAPLLGFLNQPEAVVNLTIPYFRLLLISMIPIIIFQGSKQFAEGLALTKVAMFISLGANLLNVLLNYLFIFGKMGFPAMGLNGAGYATITARTMMAAAMTAYLFFPRIKNQFNLYFRWTYFSTKTIKNLFKIGFPISLQMLFEVSAFSGATIIVGWIGAKALAAHQIALSLASFTYMAANGLAAAATVTVSNQAGKGNYPKLRKSAFSVYHLVGIFMAFCGLLFIIFRNYLPTLFIDDSEVIMLTSAILTITALFQISDGFQVTGLSALRGMEDVKVPTVITVLAYWILGLPIGYLLAFPFGLELPGIWIGLLIGLTVAAVLLTLRFHLKTTD